MKRTQPPDEIFTWVQIVSRNNHIQYLKFSSIRVIETNVGVGEFEEFGRFIGALAYTGITELNLHAYMEWYSPDSHQIGPIVGRLTRLRVFRLKYVSQLTLVSRYI